MLSTSAKSALRAAKYLRPSQHALRNFGIQRHGISSDTGAINRAGAGQAQKLCQSISWAGFPKWLPTSTAGSQNSNFYTCQCRSVHMSSCCLQDEDVNQDHETDSDEDVMADSHDQTNQTVIHYGRGG